MIDHDCRTTQQIILNGLDPPPHWRCLTVQILFSRFIPPLLAQKDKQIVGHGSQSQEYFVDAEGLGGEPFQIQVVLEFLVCFLCCSTSPIELEGPLRGDFLR